jgi:hypothetical protein
MSDPDRSVFRTVIIGPDNCGKKSLVLSTVLSGRTAVDAISDQLQYAASSLWRCRVSCCASEEERDNVVVHGLASLSVVDSKNNNSAGPTSPHSPGGNSHFPTSLLATYARPLHVMTAVPMALQAQLVNQSTCGADSSGGAGASSSGDDCIADIFCSQFDGVMCCFSVTHSDSSAADTLTAIEGACASRAKPLLFVQTRVDLAGKQSAANLMAVGDVANVPNSNTTAASVEDNECTRRCLALLRKRSAPGGGLARLFNWPAWPVSRSDIINCSATKGIGIADIQRSASDAILRGFTSSRYKPQPRANSSQVLNHWPAYTVLTLVVGMVGYSVRGADSRQNIYKVLNIYTGNILNSEQVALLKNAFASGVLFARQLAQNWIRRK